MQPDDNTRQQMVDTVNRSNKIAQELLELHRQCLSIMARQSIMLVGEIEQMALKTESGTATATFAEEIFNLAANHLREVFNELSKELESILLESLRRELGSQS